MTESTQNRRFSLSEDWLATIIGLAIVLVIGLGLLGPGPQSQTITATVGETAVEAVVPASGWKVSASVGGEGSAVEGSPFTVRQEERAVVFVCSEGRIEKTSAESLPDTDVLEGREAGRVAVILQNNCDSEATLALTRDPAIRWPVFNLLAR